MKQFASMYGGKSLSAAAKPWVPPTAAPAAGGMGNGAAAAAAGGAAAAAAAAAASDEHISRTAAKLFVGQLPFECNEQRLLELFGAYGHVEQVHILRDAQERSRGAAFITYSTTEEADTAIFTLHNRYRLLTNRAIQVSYAKHSPNISPFGAYNAMEVHNSNPTNPLPDVASTSAAQPTFF